jgi:hypothetical protein
VRQRKHLLTPLRDWEATGVWQRVERELLNPFTDADQIDWSSRPSMDLTSVLARGGQATRPNLTARQAWHEAPPDGRCPRRRARDGPHAGKHEHQEHARGRARRDPASPAPVRPARLTGSARK